MNIIDYILIIFVFCFIITDLIIYSYLTFSNFIIFICLTVFIIFREVKNFLLNIELQFKINFSH